MIRRRVTCIVGAVVLSAATACSVAAPGAAPGATTTTPLATTAPRATTTSAAPTPTLTLPPTTIEVPIVDPDVLADISTDSVPPDVIVPTHDASIDLETNPINGRRGGPRPPADDMECVIAPTVPCLFGVLDVLGFDVTTGSDDERVRRMHRAIAVLQLDAGLPMTGVPDAALLRYLGVGTGDETDETDGTDETDEGGVRPDEERVVGTSTDGRPIVAHRYGTGRRTVLVVGQTHGDEEGGLRVLLRARSLLPVREGVTLWFVPTMNPDGMILDTRYLSNGEDPNRRAPGQREQRAIYEFALDVRPSLTVWYHQNYGWVGASGASAEPAREYQELTGLGTLKRSGDCVTRGFMWCPIDDALGSSSILVELPDVVTPADVQVHALALLAVAASDAT